MNETTKRELTEWLGLCWHDGIDWDGKGGHSCKDCTVPAVYPEYGKSHYRKTFATANDVRLLTDKMCERKEGEQDVVVDKFQDYLAQAENYWSSFTACWISLSPAEQADKIHEFLTTINEIQSGG